MPAQHTESAGRSANTAPTPSQGTSPVYTPQYYQPSVPPSYAQPVPPYQPPRSRSIVGWVIAFIGMGIFAALILAVIFVTREGKRAIDRLDSGSSRAEARADETALNQTTADLEKSSGNEITLTKTFAIDGDGRIAIRNLNGGVTLESWNESQVQVTVIKRGSEQERGATQVYFKRNQAGLSLRTGGNRGEVLYQLKVPRELGGIEVNTTNGAVKLSGVSAEAVEIQSVHGTIVVSNVIGLTKAETVNGAISAALKSGADELPMEFKSVNGSIDLQLQGDFNLDLEASAVRGSITVDDQYVVEVQKQRVGQKASGRIGNGGTPLRITTINGNISLLKGRE